MGKHKQSTSSKFTEQRYSNSPFSKCLSRRKQYQPWVDIKARSEVPAKYLVHFISPKNQNTTTCQNGQHQQWSRLWPRSQGSCHEPSQARSCHDQRTALIEKVNEHCFEKCVPKPGASLSSGEGACVTQCMDKYMAVWNTVSRQYINRIQQENAKNGAGGGMF